MNARDPGEAVRQGLAILAIVWQGLWLTAEWFAHDFTVPVASALLALLTASWFGVIVSTWRGRPPFRHLMVTVNLSLLAAVAITFLLAGSAGPSVGLSAANLLVGLAGVLLPSRISIGIVILTAGLEFFILRVGVVQTSLVGDLVNVSYLVAIGTGALLARRALVDGAANAMSAQAAAADEQIRARANVAVAKRNIESERIVHETVLNTLTALGRGVVGDSSKIRQRAQQGADVIAALTSGAEFPQESSELPEVYADLVTRLRQEGIEVTWTPPSEPPALPSDVTDAVRGASVEAVENIIRHAGAKRAWITVTGDSHGLQVAIRDNGRGLRPDAQYRIGVRNVIVEAMAQVGGTATINSNDEGTLVTLIWRGTPVRRGFATDSLTILSRFTTPFLLVFWAFTAVRFAATLGEFEFPLVGAVAFAIFTALAGVLIISAQRGPLGVWQIGLVLVLAPSIYQLQQIANAAPGSDWAEWSSEAIAALFIVVIGTGPLWALFAAAGVWLVIQGDIVAELLAPGFAILMAIGIFGVSFRRNARRVEEATEQLLSSRARAEAATAVVQSTRARARIVSAGRGQQLLADIASNRLDPHEVFARDQAIAEERLLRTAMRLNPAVCAFHACLGRLAVLAYQRGVELDIDVAPANVFDRESVFFEELAEELLMHAEGPGRITMRREGNSWMLTFAIQAPTHADNLSASTSENFSTTYVPAEQLWFVEWRVRDAPSDC
jgi:hypothetical protein